MVSELPKSLLIAPFFYGGTYAVEYRLFFRSP